MREDIVIPSAGGTLAGWLYLPTNGGGTPAPVVIIAHGLGGVKEMALDRVGERFAEAGYAAVVFDYRYFGESSGEPRQLLDIEAQLADWHSALAWARQQSRLDASRTVLWGTSLSGGHVMRVAAKDPDVRAVIAQCPFTDGLASALAGGKVSTLKVGALALADLAGKMLGRPPRMVACAGPPGSAALMNAPDCAPGYLSLSSSAASARNEVAARFGLAITRYFPGRQAKDVRVPMMVALCEKDTVAPIDASARHVAKARQAEVVRYPVGHFDVYTGEPFERAMTDYLRFLARHVPITAG